MPATVTRLEIAPGTPASVIATDLNAFFASVGAIDLQDAQLYRDDNIQEQGGRLLLTYNDPGAVATYAAISFVATSAQDLATLFNLYVTANPTHRFQFLLAATPEHRRYLRPESVVVIYTPAYASACGAGMSYPRAVSAVANIAPGATGGAALVTTAGVDAANPIQVRNTFDFIWAAGETGWAVQDPATCDWIGFPTCCSAPP